MPPREELVEHYDTDKKSYRQLCEIYGVSTGTISKWMNLYEIPTRVSTKLQATIIGRVPHRPCNGPLHQGLLVPVSKFHKNPGKPLGIQFRCIECQGYKQQVDFTETYKGWLRSIVARLGISETQRRLGISEHTLASWQGKDSNHPVPLTIRRDNAISIVTLMRELRETGEVRHRKSIRRGATVRGEKERPVTRKQDLYFRSGGDAEAEAKRISRSRMTEEERESLREYDRARRRRGRSGLADQDAA